MHCSSSGCERRQEWNCLSAAFALRMIRPNISRLRTCRRIAANRRFGPQAAVDVAADSLPYRKRRCPISDLTLLDRTTSDAGLTAPELGGAENRLSRPELRE